MSRFNHTLAFPAVLILAVAVSAFAPGNASAAAAKAAVHHRHHKAMMKNASMNAKIAESDARATALASVTGGTVKSEKLENLHGRLVYHYVISLPNTSRVEKVDVDANDGTIVKWSHRHHTMSKKEAKEEQKEQSKKPR